MDAGHCDLRHRRGFTLVELLIVLAVVVILVALLLPAMGRPRGGPRHMKDATYVRAIMQGMVIWAQSNGDRYPLPGKLDAKNNTVALQAGEVPESKNTSANIMSILIFNGYIPAEMCVSPQEANRVIKPFEGYNFSAPPAAVKPADALWDPAFVADFTSKSGGGLSYAHAYPIETPGMDKMTDRWGNSFVSTEMAVGNRGPQITSVDTSGKTPQAKTAIQSSNTYLIHGGRTTWEGNIGYNDNHVDYVTSIFPALATYLDAAGKPKADCTFFDEPDAAKNENSYLGIFVKAGKQRKDFVGIWD